MTNILDWIIYNSFLLLLLYRLVHWRKLLYQKKKMAEKRSLPLLRSITKSLFHTVWSWWRGFSFTDRPSGYSLGPALLTARPMPVPCITTLKTWRMAAFRLLHTTGASWYYIIIFQSVRLQLTSCSIHYKPQGKPVDFGVFPDIIVYNSFNISI